MPRSGRYALCRLGASRPFVTPPEIAGRRREDPDGRCRSCRHHEQHTGPAPNGQIEVLDACRYHLRELLVARPTTRPCPAYKPADTISSPPPSRMEKP